MQSSGFVALRVFVMLAFLIGVPLVAIFGGSLPEVVRGIIDGQTAFQTSPSSAKTSKTGAAPIPGPAPRVQTAPQRFVAAGATPLRAGSQANPPIVQAGFTLASKTETTPSPTPNATGPAPLEQLNSPPFPAPGAAQPNGQFPQIERRLQELGASYYRLECWGGSEPVYRFHCMMQIAADPEQHRPFQGLGATAEEALARVLAEVEAWRAAGSL